MKKPGLIVLVFVLLLLIVGCLVYFTLGNSWISTKAKLVSGSLVEYHR